MKGLEVDYLALGQQLLISAQEKNILVILLCIMIGVACTFFGYQLLRFCVSAAGFVLGLLLGGGVASLMGLAMSQALIAGLACGMIMAVAAFFLYKAGVFLYAGVAALSAVINTLNVFTQNDTRWWSVILAIAAAVAVGVLAVRWMRLVIIVISAVSGAVSLTTLILPVFGDVLVVAFGIGTAVLAAAGMVYQLKATGAKAKTQVQAEAKHGEEGKRAKTEKSAGMAEDVKAESVEAETSVELQREKM